MRGFLLLSILSLLLQHSVAPPVAKNQDEEGKNKVNEVEENPEMVFEYERYLKEVVQALENDPTFREKLRKAEEADIRSGRIAHELDYVSHHVRTKLDEIKRTELERLKDLIAKKQELENDIPGDWHKLNHLDLTNHHTFEIEDLKKLIAKTTEDLAENDKQRREEFKEYEMQKKFEEEHKLKGNSELPEEEKKKYAEELEQQRQKHKKHEPLHHPGSKQQLEEVWEQQDHMQDQEFNPKTFFYMHDLDGNRLWDQDEVKALFLTELNKMYSESPEDDPRERLEEMEHMREHVFSEADTNHDGFIDLEEFIAQTKRDEYQKDPGWKGLDEQEIYSQQEYEAFERRREEEIQRMIAQGLIPPHPSYGHQGQFPQHPAEQNQVHPQGQVPIHQQQYQGQVPVHQQQQPYQGQVPVQHQQQNQVPVQQVHQGQPQYNQPQYVPRDQVPPSGQFQPDVHQQQQLNHQAVQGNVNQQQPLGQIQNTPNQAPQQHQVNQAPATGQAQQANAPQIPSVVHT